MFHYLDEFITVGAPRSDECFHSVAIMEDTCRECGMPIEFDKSEGPTTTLTFLGIELNTVALEIHLPLSKLKQLKSTLSVWRGCKACTKESFSSQPCKLVRWYKLDKHFYAA